MKNSVRTVTIKMLGFALGKDESRRSEGESVMQPRKQRPRNKKIGVSPMTVARDLKEMKKEE